MSIGFSAPKGCCLVATYRPASTTCTAATFQCPEGLLLGRNTGRTTGAISAGNVSVPRRAVAWSQRSSRRRSQSISNRFSAPKGCCLVATCPVAAGRRSVSGVSVPRRAVAWSQPRERAAAVDALECFSAPKGCCLVATSTRTRTPAPARGFQCPEGLLLGRNRRQSFGGR